MTPAWYMQFTEGHHGVLDRIGGLPTHLPPVWPTVDERPLMFIAQFACTPERLPIPDTLAIHIYQDDPDLGLPDPYVVKLPVDAAINEINAGTRCEYATQHDVSWEPREDPDECNENDLQLCSSKIWGCPYFADILQPGERFLLHLEEQPGGFNFGGDELMLAINESNDIIWVAA